MENILVAKNNYGFGFLQLLLFWITGCPSKFNSCKHNTGLSPDITGHTWEGELASSIFSRDFSLAILAASLYSANLSANWEEKEVKAFKPCDAHSVIFSGFLMDF